MNNDYNIYTANLLRTLPEALKKDESLLALAQVIAEEKHKTLELIEQNVIYARIDELQEDALDVLSYDLHVDWYDYSHPIEVKRDTIKNSVKVHMRLGTKYAVITALGALHPESDCEEWFEYGGRPFYFRIILDVTHSRVTATHSEIIKAMNFYKPKRSRLEDSPGGIIYRSRGRLEITAATGWALFNSGMTGQRAAGTFPKRSTIGVVDRTNIEIAGQASGVSYASRAAGTYPVTSTIGQIERAMLEAAAEAGGQDFLSPLTGTVPAISTGGAIERAGIGLELTGQAAAFSAKLCGTQPGSL